MSGTLTSDDHNPEPRGSESVFGTKYEERPAFGDDDNSESYEAQIYDNGELFNTV
jgi:hypothetical protein